MAYKEWLITTKFDDKIRFVPVPESVAKEIIKDYLKEPYEL